ncbi:MAG: ABC transporter substrate-binding protein [Acidiferrobacter sp.]
MRRWQQTKSVILRVGVLSLMLAGTAVAGTAVAPAVAVVAQFQGTLLKIMKGAHRLHFQGRYQRLAPAVRQSHDLGFIAEVTLGPYWQRLTPAERTQFIQVFTRLTIATYASEFNGYTPGQHFISTAAHPLGNGDVIVETALQKGRKRQATLDYLLAPVRGSWQIVNIVANGVSDLALKRAQYTAIMKKGGFTVLMKKLRAKVALLMAPKKAGA